MPSHTSASLPPFPTLKRALVGLVEELLVDIAIQRTGSHKEAAAALGLDPANFRRLLRKLAAARATRAAAQASRRHQGPSIKKAVPRLPRQVTPEAA